jgi:hypothetical protein
LAVQCNRQKEQLGCSQNFKEKIGITDEDLQPFIGIMEFIWEAAELLNEEWNQRSSIELPEKWGVE